MKTKNSHIRRNDRDVSPSSGLHEQQVTTASNAGKCRDVTACSTPRQRTRVETSVILHELEEDGTPGSADAYLRKRGVVHRAMQLLEGWKFLPARISSSKVPVDIIALRKDMALLIQVISSKRPVPDAKTLVRLYKGKVRALRDMGTTAQFRKMLLAWSNPCGWKYYEVLPGGIMPAWDLPVIPADHT